MLRDAQAHHLEVVFVFTNQGESEGAVQQYLAAEHLDLTNALLDPCMQTGQAMNVIALPTTLIFDAQGKLVWRHLGEFLNRCWPGRSRRLKRQAREADR